MKTTKRYTLVICLSLSLLAACTAPPNDAPAAEAKDAAAATPAPGAYRIYVTNERSGDLSIIDSSTHEVVSTVPLGKRPRGIHLSPDGNTIYVALSGSPIGGPNVDESKLPPADKKADGIGIFDIKQGKLLKMIQAGSDPEEFDLSKDGTLLYGSNEDTGEATIVDVMAGKIVATLKVGDEEAEPEGVATTPDGKFVYVTSENYGTISVIDTAAQKVLKTFEVGHRPRDIAFLPDLTKAYVTLENDGKLAVVNPMKHTKTGEIVIGKTDDLIKPMSVLLSSDSKTAYVSAGRGKKVFIVDTATDKVTGSIEVGDRPWGIALSPDGKYLYTANGPSNDVSVVDLATQTVMKKIKVGESPWGVITVKQ
jgi:YVTN family beta-propeller protein